MLNDMKAYPFNSKELTLATKEGLTLVNIEQSMVKVLRH
jgi:hypothetical protein